MSALSADLPFPAGSALLAHNEYSRSDLTWPGDVYIEDINAESDLGLIKTIVESVAIHGRAAT